MRIDDHDDIDLSRHRGSRIPGMLVIGAALGVALIAAWVFTPILISRDSAATGGLFARAKPRPPAQEQAPAPMLASAQAAPTVPTAPPAANTPPPAASEDQAASAAPPAAPAVAETTASTPLNAPWPQGRGIQLAAAPPADVGAMQEATAAPPDTPAVEPSDNVPMPRKRPSRQIAASLITPLPRPRPEIDGDPPPAPSTFDLQVERMR